jgi:hypothetical protein
VLLRNRAWTTRSASQHPLRPRIRSPHPYILFNPGFATVRLRQRTTKGPGNRAAGIAMAYKLMDAAQHRWRRINGHELVALVRAGATFIDGKLQERSDTTTEMTTKECAA